MRCHPPWSAGTQSTLVLTRCLARASHIGRVISVNELPLSVNQQGFEVVIGIASFVPRCSVADFEVHNLFCGFIDQAVSIACACLETCAHSGRETGSTFVGV